MGFNLQLLFTGIGVGTSDNHIEGNFIGTDKNGKATGLGNVGDGVDIFGGASGNTIGGLIGSVGTQGGGNVIANNNGDGF